MGERYAVMTLARSRAPWVERLSSWATAVLVPVELTRCVSAVDVRARLAGDRRFSALLVDADHGPLDRDLRTELSRLKLTVVIVDRSSTQASEPTAGLPSLPCDFGPDQITELLRHACQPLGPAVSRTGGNRHEPGRDLGRFVAVTGTGGAGASICAMALAQGLAGRRHGFARLRGRPRSEVGSDRVILADLCLEADLAMFHAVGLQVPALQELVDMHRFSLPADDEVAAVTVDGSHRGYRLLTGLRRSRQWVLLHPQALRAAVSSLQGIAGVVVADVDRCVEGENETGSVDLEERHLLARTAFERADVILAVSEPSLKGVHSLVRLVGNLVDFGVDASRLLPVLNRCDRPPVAARRALTALAQSQSAVGTEITDDVVCLPRRNLEAVVRDGRPLPNVLASRLAGAVARRLQGPARRPAIEPVPDPVVPGSLGLGAGG